MATPLLIDAVQTRSPLRLGECEFNWIAVEGTGEGPRGKRRLAMLIWLSLTATRRGARIEPSVVPREELPAIVRAFVPTWLPVLSPLRVESDDRPLFLFALYDLDAPQGGVRVVELPIAHGDLDRATFSARTESRELALDQRPDGTTFVADVRARAADFEVHLDLRGEKPPVGFGPDGAPEMQQGPVRLSYAQRPRLAVNGEITLAGERITRFTGTACQDRQWLTVTPAATRLKWIWLHLALGDGREVTGFVMRDSGAGRWASANDGRLLDRRGWLVTKNGDVEELPRFDVRALEEHEVRTDRGLCPTRFVVEAPELDLSITLAHAIATPFIPMKAFGPSLDAGIWEGPAHVAPSSRPFTGRAWIEVMNAATARFA